MYNIDTFNLRGFEEIVLSDSGKKNSCSIVPQFGANIRELILCNESIIDGYKTLEEFKQNKSYKSSFLIPFPNRIASGKYFYKSNYHQFPKNDGPNALHGFFHNREVVLNKKTVNGKSASISFDYIYCGDYQGYPFNFKTEVMISLDDDGFHCFLEIISNEDDGMPVGIGWHPYFKLGTDPIDTLQLKIPNCRLIKTDTNQIPNKESIPLTSYNQPKLIKDEHFDTGFVVSSNQCSIELYSEEKKKGIRIDQRRNRAKDLFVQIYTPPDRKSIAIEPMTCAADSFNNMMGLEILNKGEKLKTSINISLFKR